MSGTVLSQVITVVAAPFLSRLYNGEQFGVLALYMSISSLFILVAAARYEVAIVLPDEENKAHNLVALSLFIITAMTVLSFIIILIFRDLLSFCLKNRNLAFSCYLFRCRFCPWDFTRFFTIGASGKKNSG
jgi:O-antigen/teichoic acid export membrane protein